MKQINFLNNFAKFNSIKDRKSIIKVINEATRNLTEYKNNVNHNLSVNNVELVRYRKELLNTQFYDTEVNERANDIITCISRINTQDISEKINEDLTYFLTKKDWENYFRKVLEIQKKSLGENANCVYAILHMDEATPHLHSMFTISRKKVKKAVYNEADVDKEKLNKSLKMSFSRFCKKNNINKQNFDKEKYKNFEQFKAEYFEENRQKKIEFQVNKLNKQTSTKNFEFSTTSNLRINYSRFGEDFVKEMKQNKEVNLFKSNIEKVLKEDIEIVKKFDKSLVKSKDLENIKTEIKETKLNLVKDFLKDMNNKEKREKMQDFFYKENIVKNKKEMTNEEFEFKMNKIQKILNENNDFEIEKIKQLKTMKRKENIDKIINFVKSKFDNKEVKKVKEFYKKFDKKLDKINEEKLLKLEANETKIFNKNKDLNNLNLSINESTLNLNNLNKEMKETEAELKQINDNIDNSKNILNNQKKIIENNEEKIRKQNKEINENINIRKNMKYIEKEAINQLKNDIKSNYNFIKQIKEEAKEEVKEEYLNSKSFKNNVEVNVLDKKIAEQNDELERIINKKNIIEEETEKIKNNAIKEAELIKNNTMKKINEEILKKEKEIREKEFKLKQLNQKYNNLSEKANQIEEKMLENTDTYEKEIEEKIKSELKSEKKEDFELFCSFNKNLEKSIRRTEKLSRSEANEIIYNTFTEANESIEKKHFNFKEIFEKLFNFLKLNVEDFKSKNNTHNLSRNASNLSKSNDRQ